MKIRNHLLFLGFTAATLTLHADDASEAVARVGDIEITVADIRPRLADLGEREQTALRDQPALLNQFVRSLIVQQLVLRQAQAENWAEQPEVAEQLEELREKAITQTFLADKSKPIEDYPSDAEIQSAYNENKAALKIAPQVRLAQIFVALPDGAGQEAAALAAVKLDEIASELKKTGADFAAIAKARSEEPQSAAQGGEIGWLTQDQIQPEIREELGKLDAGKVSEPIRIADGFHIVKVLETKPETTPEFADVRDALAERLRQARAQQNSQEYVAELLEANPIAINEMALGELIPAKE